MKTHAMSVSEDVAALPGSCRTEEGRRELILSRGRYGYIAKYRWLPAEDVVLILAVRHQRCRPCGCRTGPGPVSSHRRNSFRHEVQMDAPLALRRSRNGMDAPTLNGIGCAKVEVLSNHKTGRSVRDEHYDDGYRFSKECVSGSWG